MSGYLYEFMGGPMDGELMMHPTILRELRVAIPSRINWWAPTQTPDDTITLREGRYEVRRATKYFGDIPSHTIHRPYYAIALYWQGEE